MDLYSFTKGNLTEAYYIVAKLSEVKCKVSKVAKIRNRYNQVPHLTQDTNGKVSGLK